jgi:hypothetical protein
MHGKRVFHVTTNKKLEKYKRTGFIKAPVRAWESIESAETFAKQTGRRIILILHFPADIVPEKRRTGNAYILQENYMLDF